jgi:hypothetical protein
LETILLNNMKPSIKNITKKTPLLAKKIGAACAAISTGIGTLGYMTSLPMYIHLGAFTFVLSVIIPLLFSEDEEGDK